LCFTAGRSKGFPCKESKQGMAASLSLFVYINETVNNILEKDERKSEIMICVEIDELTPCLRDVNTGDIVETEVIRIKRKSFLQKFNKNTGWYTSWAKEIELNEVYALVIKGTVDIQGLVSVRNDLEMKATFISWMVAAPHNNPQLTDNKKYEGVGGHLFAIAAQRSYDYGYECEMTGFAANQRLKEHYMEAFGAIPIQMLHPYHIVIMPEQGCKIREVYTYEWTDDEL